MKILPIIIFGLTLIADGIVLPAGLGFLESFLVFIFLVALMLSYGTPRWLILYAIAFSLIIELLYGFRFGLVAMPWIITALLWNGITQLFSIKADHEGRRGFVGPLILSGVGVILLAIFSSLFLLVEGFLYRMPVTWQFIVQSWLHSGLVIYAFISFIVYIFLFRIRLRSRKDYYV